MALRRTSVDLSVEGIEAGSCVNPGILRRYGMSQAKLSDDGESLIWDQWRRHADAVPDAEAIVHVSMGAPTRRWNWGELMRSASHVSRRLRHSGVRRGEVCALIIRHHPSFYPVYLGVCAVGALAAVLAYPSARLHPEKFREGLRGMSQRSGLDHILTEHDLTETLVPLVAGDDSTPRTPCSPQAAQLRYGMALDAQGRGRDDRFAGRPSATQVMRAARLGPTIRIEP